jgi:glyoxylase-like metal-dependent hydrolase (beta-lactamase superfamily II)
MAPPRVALARAIAEGVFYVPLGGCNVYLVGSAAQWVLIDTGWPKSAEPIRMAAESLFGPDARPAAILITHAHPDHVGSAAELARLWGAPIYAPRDDLPYLEGGILPDELLDPIGRVFNPVTRVLPRRTVERMTASRLKGAVLALPGPESGVPGLPDWEYIHVPGHSPGHVVFFRRRDRVLIAGDVVLTAPLWGSLSVIQRLSPPPKFVSWNWERTKTAAVTISELEPRVLAPGHGVPMSGVRVADDLRRFAERFSG